jgi:hypothetical protein
MISGLFSQNAKELRAPRNIEVDRQGADPILSAPAFLEQGLTPQLLIENLIFITDSWTVRQSECGIGIPSRARTHFSTDRIRILQNTDCDFATPHRNILILHGFRPFNALNRPCSAIRADDKIQGARHRRWRGLNRL